jgi:hypothetical protein
MNKIFLEALQKNQWTEISNDCKYKKGEWLIARDTSSWYMIINSKTNFRVLAYPEPSAYTAPLTVNLIEHLCKRYNQDSQ